VVLGVTSSNVNFNTLIIHRRLKPATILSLNLLHPDFPFLHPHPMPLAPVLSDTRNNIKWGQVDLLDVLMRNIIAKMYLTSIFIKHIINA